MSNENSKPSEKPMHDESNVTIDDEKRTAAGEFFFWAQIGFLTTLILAMFVGLAYMYGAF